MVLGTLSFYMTLMKVLSVNVLWEQSLGYLYIWTAKEEVNEEALTLL